MSKDYRSPSCITPEDITEHMQNLESNHILQRCRENLPELVYGANDGVVAILGRLLIKTEKSAPIR